VGKPPRPADVLLAEAPVRQPAHQPAELGVVAELRVGIEGQMVGEQVDVVGKQRRQPRRRMPVTQPSSPRQK
jgi:hypothetical protein